MRTNLSKQAGLLLAVAAAAIVGGATTAIVSAAIPSTADGKIYGCYTQAKGALRVIDNQAGQTCTSQETDLNWDQTSTSKAYAHITGTVDETTGNITNQLDTLRSSGITNIQFVPNGGDAVACITVLFEPKNVMVTGGGSFPPSIALKNTGLNPEQNGWSNANGNQFCNSTGANAYLGTLGLESWLTFTR